MQPQLIYETGNPLELLERELLKKMRWNCVLAQFPSLVSSQPYSPLNEVKAGMLQQEC